MADQKIGWVLALLGFSGVAMAQAPERSERPLARVETLSSQDPAPIVSQIETLRPIARPADLNERAQAQQTGRAVGFADWLVAFRGRALIQGVPSQVLDASLPGLNYDPEVIKRDRNQSEFTKTIWDYLDSAASQTRIDNGRAALDAHSAVLARIEAEFGVEKEIVVAIWGLESAYGTFKGTTNIIEALATLAYDGRRGSFFEAQLVAALKIIEAGDIAPDAMTGSWAGAMGHTQFIPTSYLTYAVDFTGNGKRDIWGDDPSDALASTAAYLKAFGWTTGQPWGVEITLPPEFDYLQANRKIKRLPSQWAELGVRGVSEDLIDHGPASVLLPAGAQGAAFLVFDNFAVIERYNTADAYVIGVGHLADRIAGGDAFNAQWPRNDRALTLEERLELQRRLTAAGFNTRGVDGKIGPLTIEAVRQFQRSIRVEPDGYASLAVLEQLR